jgi:tRNA/tmRNA/rRNA uracil-C5-methylase (TrmA/RlmC/RlmD family)
MKSPPRKFNPIPFSYHQELELTIEKLTNLGQGLARHGEEKWVIFVPFALPGEKVRVRIFRNHANYSDCDLLEIIEPSPHRVEPACPLFGECGGCQYQNFAYSEQISWKQQQVTELLLHMGGIRFDVQPIIASPKEYGYRSKITPHFQKPSKRDKDSITAIGFLKNGRRNELIDVPQCPIAMDNINETLPKTRDFVFKNAQRYKKGATLLLRACDEGVLTDSKDIATETVGNLKFQFLAGDFFQNNPFILPAFTDYVAAEAAASGATHLVDAYCGSGLFCISAAHKFQTATGIEISESSIAWATKNAALNKIENCNFHAGTVEDIFAGVADNTKTGNDFAVIIDPPRKGSSIEFLQQLFTFRPRAVVYVSCNPSTQMRDLKEFLAAGYELQKVQPFDLFPQTRHLECVMTLVDKS